MMAARSPRPSWRALPAASLPARRAVSLINERHAVLHVF
jgi:hypothetical protein